MMACTEKQISVLAHSRTLTYKVEPEQLVSACSRVCLLPSKGREVRPSRLLHQPTPGLLVQAWRACLSNVHAHTGPLLLICCQSEMKRQETVSSELRQQDEGLGTGVQARRGASRLRDERPGQEMSIQPWRGASKPGDERPGLETSLWDWGRASRSGDKPLGLGPETSIWAWRRASKPEDEHPGQETSLWDWGCPGLETSETS